MKALKESNIVICGIVKNAAANLRKNIPVMDAVCGVSGDYHVVIFEDGSSDGTKEVLKDWSERNDRVSVFFDHKLSQDKVIMELPNEENEGSPFYAANRNAKMATLRNQYLEYIDSQSWNLDYVVIVDLDVEKISLDGIFSSFATVEDWDAITANGHSLSPHLKRRFHDTYPLIEVGHGDDVRRESDMKILSAKYANLKPGDSLVRVYSAYGGLAIYRYAAIKGLRYKLEYNKDPNVQSYAEHVSLYRQMHERGYENIYINPSMEIKYQSILRLSTLKNSMKSRLSKLFRILKK